MHLLELRVFRLTAITCRAFQNRNRGINTLEVEKMNTKRTGAFVVAVLLGAFLSGCCGGGTTVQPTPVTIAPASGATVGQQLIELQKAYESGAITEAEYKKLKQEAMDKASK
jgi:hypothetical protein